MLRFTEDSPSPSVGVCSEQGRRLCCLPNSAIHTTLACLWAQMACPGCTPRVSELRWVNAGAQPGPSHPLPSPQTHTRWVSWPFAPESPLCSCVLDQGELTSANSWAHLRRCPPLPELRLGPSSAQGSLPPKSTSATSYQLHLPLPLSSRCVDGTTLLELSLAVGSQASHLTSLSLGSCWCQIGIMFFSPTL